MRLLSSQGNVWKGAHHTLSTGILVPPLCFRNVENNKKFRRSLKTSDNHIQSSMNVRVVTWNVLADSYSKAVRKCSKINDVQPEMFESILNWSARFQKITQCIDATNADILCLQEVDHFKDSFLVYCASIGYGAVYVQRPQKDDGCLIIYNRLKYEIVSTQEINLDDIAELYRTNILNNNNRSKYAKQNVAVIVQFRVVDCPSKVFNLCTCHIHWNPNLLDVKLAQAKYILKHLYESIAVSSVNSEKEASTSAATAETSCRCSDTSPISTQSCIPVIFTGDFNSLPHDLIYNAITTRFDSLNAIDQLVLAASESQSTADGDCSVVQAHENDYYVGGAKTRFLCDSTMYKLGKWMRVLGERIFLCDILTFSSSRQSHTMRFNTQVLTWRLMVGSAKTAHSALPTSRPSSSVRAKRSESFSPPLRPSESAPLARTAV